MNLGYIIGTKLGQAVREQVEPARRTDYWHQIGHASLEQVQPARQTGFWHQVGYMSIEQVRVTVEHLDPVHYEVWSTREDERTCPICGQLDGQVWLAGDGFFPPVHDNCRCTRAYHHTEFRRRFIEEWRDVAVNRTSWQWMTSS